MGRGALKIFTLSPTAGKLAPGNSGQSPFPPRMASGLASQRSRGLAAATKQAKRLYDILSLLLQSEH